MKILELFSGTESFSKVARKLGHETFTIDNNSHFNPDLCIDILNLTIDMIPFKPDVVYLDPMYPEKRKPALVKKEMRVFKGLVGNDPDAGDLLNIALKVAFGRVVVKRPAHADWLTEQKPDTSIMTKKNRFDIYLVSKYHLTH